MTKVQKLKCFFGSHNFTIPDKIDPGILICKHCKNVGYHIVSSINHKIYYNYDKEGQLIHCQHSDGYEEWYDDDRYVTRVKSND